MIEQETSTDHIKKNQNRIPVGQLAAYGAGGMIPIALFNITGILVGLIGNISLGISAFWLGFILIIPRLWDALSDPIIGHLSDNTRTRWGRRRPFLLIGGLLVAVFFVLIWWIPKGDMVRLWFPTEAGFQWFQLSYILVTLLLFFTACNIFEIPHGALGMEMTTDYHERTRLFSAKSLVGNFFAMIIAWLLPLASLEIFKGPGGNEADGMRYVSLLIAAILIPLSFWWFFKLREPGFARASKQEKTPFWKDMKRTATNKNFIMLTLTIFTLAMGFNFVQLLGSYIPIFYVFQGDKVAGATLLGINGTVWAITGLLAVFPLNWISPKLGKRKTLTLAIILMCLAQISKIFCYNPTYPYLIIIPTVLLSMGMLFFFTLGSSMVGDICDEYDLKTGFRSEGSFYSIFWWFIKMGTALASFVAGALIVLTLFDQTQVTKVDSLQGSVREMRSKVQAWSGIQGLSGTNTELLEKTKTLSLEALNESKEYSKYLEKELVKKGSETNQDVIADQGMIIDLLSSTLAQTKTNSKEQEQLKLQLDKLDHQSQTSEIKSIATGAIPLALQTNLAKARMNSYILLSHLEAKSLEKKKSTEHYDVLIKNITGINSRLASMNPSFSLESLDKELETIEKNILPLTKQTPYTLLMMRIVEIGLPLLLSIFSIFFVLRYSLTEKRSHEIKELLTERNMNRLQNQSQ
jgi:GPH family glycoside/pentoside/hexuronide:cation symporter